MFCAVEHKITEAIVELRNEYLAKGKAPDLPSINHGLCDIFAVDLALKFPELDTLQVVGITDFVEIDPDTGCAYDCGGSFDLKLISEHWPHFTPPGDLTWDDMNQLSADAGFSCGTHVFLTYDGKFFDAEAEQGVLTPFELPFFKRVISSWLEEREILPRP